MISRSFYDNELWLPNNNQLLNGYRDRRSTIDFIAKNVCVRACADVCMCTRSERAAEVVFFPKRRRRQPPMSTVLFHRRTDWCALACVYYRTVCGATMPVNVFGLKRLSV